MTLIRAMFTYKDAENYFNRQIERITTKNIAIIAKISTHLFSDETSGDGKTQPAMRRSHGGHAPSRLPAQATTANEEAKW